MKEMKELHFEGAEYRLVEFEDVILGRMVDVYKKAPNGAFVYLDEMLGGLDDKDLRAKLEVLIRLHDNQERDSVQEVN